MSNNETAQHYASLFVGYRSFSNDEKMARVLDTARVAGLLDEVAAIVAAYDEKESVASAAKRLLAAGWGIVPPLND